MIKIGDFIFGEEEKKNINNVINSNRVTHGGYYTKKFEENFSESIGSKYCLVTNSGTSALMLAYSLFREDFFDERKELITTPLSFVATTNAMILTGFKPRFVDVGINDINMDVKSLEEIILSKDFDNRKTVGIVPVHLLGYPNDMHKITDLARNNDLKIIEDACEAQGSKFEGKNLGTIGDLGVYSFYISHIITGGEMGCVVTDNKELYDEMLSRRAHGYENGYNPRYIHSHIGYNLKTTELSAALALPQLERLDDILRIRSKNAKHYHDNIENPIFDKGACSDDVAYLGYPLFLKENHGILPFSSYSLNPTRHVRDSVINILYDKGIETRPLFPPIHKQPAYFKYFGYESYPNAENISSRGLYLPVHPFLSQENLDYIVESVNKFKL